MLSDNSLSVTTITLFFVLQGSVAPWWETSKEGTELLLEKGIEYGECGTPYHILSDVHNSGNLKIIPAWHTSKFYLCLDSYRIER